MNQVVNIDGVLYGPDDAKISVFDHGFLYGDSIYETMRTFHRKIFLVDRHLTRLQNSARMLSLPLPAPGEKLQAELERTIAATSNPECYVRMIITRGKGKIGLDVALSQGSSYVIIVMPLDPHPVEYYEKGVKVAIVDVRRNDRLSLNPGIKTCNLLNNVLAYMQTKEENAFEGLLCNLAGYVTEGTVTNVFFVQDGILITPPAEAGLLLGVTRGLTLELASREDIPSSEKNLTPEDVMKCEECFLTGTTKGIMPVNQIGSRFLSPAPGPVTKKLMTAYHQFVEESTRS